MRRPPLFVYASSPEVYGAPVRVPMDEWHPLQPRSVYAASKVAGEMHCLAIHRWWGHPVVVIRNFNTFGPHQNLVGYPAVIPAFIVRALRGEPLRVEGGGTQTRDFMYIDDAVDAYARVLAAGPRLAGSVFNIGTGRETSIRDLAGLVVRATGSKSAVEVMPGRPSDLPALCADTSRIERELGWRAETPLAAGHRAHGGLAAGGSTREGPVHNLSVIPVKRDLCINGRQPTPKPRSTLTPVSSTGQALTLSLQGRGDRTRCPVHAGGVLQRSPENGNPRPT